MDATVDAHPDEQTSSTLDDVRLMPEPQFRQQLLDWMQTAEVSQRLQAKLRTDLFGAFNATTLGRQIASRHQHRTTNAAGLLFASSPVLLALNTLAAEFLYTQNCQFTLSVLATETPHPNTMPDFAGARTPFRFGRRQVQQLLQSLGAVGTAAENIGAAYRAATAGDGEELVNNSLLFTLCQETPLFGQQRPSADQCTQTAPVAVAQPKRTIRSRRRSFASTGTDDADVASSSMPQRSTGQRPLQASIKLLTAHVVQLSDAIGDFAADSGDPHPRVDRLRLAKLRERLQRFGRQRPKTTRNLKHLTRAVGGLARRLERCLRGVQQTLLGQLHEDARKIRQTVEATPLPMPPLQTTAANADAPTADAVGYSAWVQQLKYSKHGRRFLEHLRAHHRSVWAREMERQRTDWELKFQQERRLLKLHYKQRLLERYRDLIGTVGIGAEPERHETAAARHSDAAVMTDGDAETRAMGAFRRKEGRAERPSHLDLSNRKLPDIHISPDSPAEPLRMRPVLPVCTDADHTRARVQELEAASEAIEQSVQQRLQQHTVERRKIAAQQRHIQHQSFVGQQLIGKPVSRAGPIGPDAMRPTVRDEPADPAAANGNG